MTYRSLIRAARAARYLAPLTLLLAAGCRETSAISGPGDTEAECTTAACTSYRAMSATSVVALIDAATTMALRLQDAALGRELVGKLGTLSRAVTINDPNGTRVALAGVLTTIDRVAKATPQARDMPDLMVMRLSLEPLIHRFGLR